MTEEQSAINELKAMPRDQLDLVDYDLKKWICSGKVCRNGTKVRDYGIAPVFYHQRGKGEWMNVSGQFWMCSKHWKMYHRLVKSFNHDDVVKKLFNLTNMQEMIPLQKPLKKHEDDL